MFSVEFWFDSGLNTTQYGGSSDEKILDLGPTVWAQWPNLSTEMGPALLKTGILAPHLRVLLDHF